MNLFSCSYKTMLKTLHKKIVLISKTILCSNSIGAEWCFKAAIAKGLSPHFKYKNIKKQKGWKNSAFRMKQFSDDFLTRSLTYTQYSKIIFYSFLKLSGFFQLQFRKSFALCAFFKSFYVELIHAWSLFQYDFFISFFVQAL